MTSLPNASDYVQDAQRALETAHLVRLHAFACERAESLFLNELADKYSAVAKLHMDMAGMMMRKDLIK